MTHKDIYTKFMIEYDKANVTSSYPSLTEYEIATVLDKAYNALIAQKVTGNNVRRSPFEADTKAVSDLQQLVVKVLYPANKITDNGHDGVFDFDNNMSVKLPEDFLYFVGCQVRKQFNVASQTDSHYSTQSEYIGPIDQKGSGAPVRTRRMNAKLISHQMADKFKASAHNIPWIKDPVCYIEDGYLYIVYDSYDAPQKDFVEITYIKAPNKFAKDLDKLGDISELWKNVNHSDFTREDLEMLDPTTLSYFFWSNNTNLKDVDAGFRNAYHALVAYLDSVYTFECNDTMAEELISLAVSFALENVESQRLNSKLNMRGLEA